MVLEFSLPSPPTDLTIMDQLHLNHGADFGNHGHLQNAKFFFGWPSETDVGLLIGLPKEVSPIRANALSVIRSLRRCNTSLPHVFSPENSGLEFERPSGCKTLYQGGQRCLFWTGGTRRSSEYRRNRGRALIRHHFGGLGIVET